MSQIVLTALSSDQEQYLDILSILGASAALMISNIPFQGPVGAVRVGCIDGEFVFNPTVTEMKKSILDLRLAGTADAILMVEAGATIVSEKLMIEALKQGHAAMQESIQTQLQMAAEVGKPKSEVQVVEVSDSVRQEVFQAVGSRIVDTLNAAETKEARYTALAHWRMSLSSASNPAWLLRIPPSPKEKSAAHSRNWSRNRSASRF